MKIMKQCTSASVISNASVIRVLYIGTYEGTKPSKHVRHPDSARLGQIFNIFPLDNVQIF